MTKEIEEKGMSMKDARKRNMWSIIPISKLPDNSPVLAITQYPSKALADFHLAEECIVPNLGPIDGTVESNDINNSLLTPSGDVQERAKEVGAHAKQYATAWKYDMGPMHGYTAIHWKNGYLSGASSMQAEVERLREANSQLLQELGRIKHVTKCEWTRNKAEEIIALNKQ